MSEQREQPIKSADEKSHGSDQGSQCNQDVSSTIISAPSCPPTELHASDNSKHTKQDNPNWCEIGMFLLELVGVVGLFFYCVVNWLEWRTFDSERVIMEDEFKTSQKERILDERAWVLTTRITDVASSKDSLNYIVSIPFRNTGKTPALNVKGFCAFVVNENEIPKTNDIVPSWEYEGLCAPDSGGQLQPPAIPKYLMDNGAPLYIYGTIRYEDIFHQPHWSQFCYKAKGRPLDAGFITIEGFKTHNSCDDSENNGPK